MPKISIIIPAYCCGKTLKTTLESVLAAGLPDFEVLLIDDGSTDDTGALCDKLAVQFPPIRVIHQSNGGASAARNRGIREAAGELLLFMDADDSIEPDLLRKILSDPRCGQADLTIYGLTFDYYKNGKRYRRDPLFYPADGILSALVWGSAFTELYEKNSLSSICNKVFKRDILTRNSLFLNETMFLYEDLEFVLRYMEHCDRIWNVPLAVYHYRQAEDEGNAKRRLARIDSIPQFLQPIETALTQLSLRNPAISSDQANHILQRLHLVLAREKVSVSTIAGIRGICDGFLQWSLFHPLPLDASRFQKRLQNKRATLLWLADKKTALRHGIAVWVKSHLYQVKA